MLLGWSANKYYSSSVKHEPHCKSSTRCSIVFNSEVVLVALWDGTVQEGHKMLTQHDASSVGWCSQCVACRVHCQVSVSLLS